MAAAGAGVPDVIAGALKRFGLKHPTRPVGIAKIDLASSFTDASLPANAISGVTSNPTTAAGQLCHYLGTIKSLMLLHEMQVFSLQLVTTGSCWCCNFSTIEGQRVS